MALAAVLAWSVLTFISLEFAVIANKPTRTLAVVTPWPLLKYRQAIIKKFKHVSNLSKFDLVWFKKNKGEKKCIRTLQVPPFLHRPWQLLTSKENEDDQDTKFTS